MRHECIALAAGSDRRLLDRIPRPVLARSVLPRLQGSNGVVPQVEFELCLAEQLLVCVLDLPGLCNHFTTSGQDIINQYAVDVSTVDEQLVDGESLLVQVV